jgi:hypothetical protein
VERTANPQRTFPVAALFSAADRPVLPLSLSFGLNRGHAHRGGARRRRMALKKSLAKTEPPTNDTTRRRAAQDVNKSKSHWEE